ncbi:MAG: sodium:proton antiporter NhaD [Saprospiraceae bacterium]
MAVAPLIVFCIGYLFIIFEHASKVNKTVSALLVGVLIWAIIFVFELPLIGIEDKDQSLLHHIGKIAEIIFFLKGAMTIVELVDLHRGFGWITRYVQTDSKRKLLWLIGVGTFFMSAILDNLTTTIVVISLLKKLMDDKEDRLWFASFVVLAANAGGAWSPIGDVTTTMLWIDHKVSGPMLVLQLFLPSLICLAVPLIICSLMPRFKTSIKRVAVMPDQAEDLLSSRVMFWIGLAALVFVPVFKTISHLPPYMGMLFALAMVWMASEFMHPEENFDEERRYLYSAQKALSRVDFSSLLFFIGILLAIAGLEAQGSLSSFAELINKFISSKAIVAVCMGLSSAVIDNVPLVAAAMSMYHEPIDSEFWHLLAYTCGTGGSLLIIGSAAGVAAMGIVEIDFIWYFKKISWIATLGYFAGVAVFLLMN